MPGYKRYEAYKALILLGFCCMLSYFLFTQKIKLYINPRFTVLTVAADIVIFLLFLVQGSMVVFKKPHIGEPSHHHKTSIWPIVPFVIPLLFVLVMPNATLDASIAADRGVSISSVDASPNANGSASGTTTSSSGTASQQNSTGYRQDNSQYDYSRDPHLVVTDDNFVNLVSQIYENPKEFVGKDITMMGFVVRDSDFSAKQIGIVRYVITCCTADAMPCGFLCEYENASSIKDGTWLEVNGTIDMAKLRNTDFAVVKIKSIQTVKEPQMPYVYPRY
ncbi:MAG: TIGR03943 family protein [Syntrophomonadaceae bacterium]